jgi:hypothetical protein
MSQVCLEDLVAEHLRTTLTDPKSSPPVVSQSTIQLLNGSWYSVDLTVNHAKQPSAHIQSQHNAVIMFVTSYSYQLYDIHGYEPHYFNAEAFVTQGRSGTFEPAETFALDESKNVLDLWHSAVGAHITLTNKFEQHIAYRFDGTSGRAVSHYNSAPAISVLEHIAAFLGFYGDSTSVPQLRKLLEHVNESVRWEAACALSHIDRDEGLSAFALLARSSKGETAAAANKVLTASK